MKRKKEKPLDRTVIFPPIYSNYTASFKLIEHYRIQRIFQVSEI